VGGWVGGLAVLAVVVVAVVGSRPPLSLFLCSGFIDHGQQHRNHAVRPKVRLKEMCTLCRTVSSLRLATNIAAGGPKHSLSTNHTTDVHQP
jgi:hypothetical protein